jgi:hypothetical protein
MFKVQYDDHDAMSEQAFEFGIRAFAAGTR